MAKEFRFGFTGGFEKKAVVKKNRYWLHILLFLLTFVFTTIAGAQWANKDISDISNWQYGITYAILLLTFLSAHEFGHYFAARYHKIDTTLPFYIPNPIPGIINFGTFGAVIRTRSPFTSRKALFDVGVAGPLAGFVVAFFFIICGLETLPGKEYIYNIHPEYLINYGGEIPKTSLHFGDTLLYWLSVKAFANPSGFVPPMNEIYHYPFLCVGWFGLFVTSLNMIPCGQLDGGHIVYAMFGRHQKTIARVAWWTLLILGIGALLNILNEAFMDDYPNKIYIFFQNLLHPALVSMKSQVPWFFQSMPGWLFWAFIIKIFLKLPHPEIDDDEPIGEARMLLGWIAIAILVLSFSYNGIYEVM